MKKFFTGDRSSLFSKLGIVYGNIITDGMEPETVYTVEQGERVTMHMAELSLIPGKEIDTICKYLIKKGVCKDVQAVANLVLHSKITLPRNFKSRWQFKFSKCGDCPKIHGVLANKIANAQMGGIDTFWDALDICDQLFRGKKDEEMSLEEAVYVLQKALEANIDLEEADEDEEEDKVASAN